MWATPATGGGRIGFPEDHPAFQGVLPPAVGPLSETLAGHDLILVAGSSVFPYYPNIPGPLLPEGSSLQWRSVTRLPPTRPRARHGGRHRGGRARYTLEALLAELGDETPDREPPQPRTIEPVPESDPMSPSAAAQALLADVFPADGIAVVESPSATLALRNRLRLSKPGSYYFGAGGGLGFGLAAAVGVQLAEPDRPVVCVIGGSNRSTRSRPSGPPPPTRCPSRSWCCATRSTRS